MRDFRDAKAMAVTLREALTAQKGSVGHADCLELVSQMLGFADWNTLSAFINKQKHSSQQVSSDSQVSSRWPVFPIKDLVPLPATQLPLWLKRPKTIQALNQAFARRREIILVAQKDHKMEDPTADDLYDVGVVARILDVGAPSQEAIGQNPILEGSTQIILQTQGRVRIRDFSGKDGGYEADVELINEGEIRPAPELIAAAATKFENYAAVKGINVSGIWPPLNKLHDAGRVADVITHRLPLPVAQKQIIMATLDPIGRLEKAVEHLDI